MKCNKCGGTVIGDNLICDNCRDEDNIGETDSQYEEGLPDQKEGESGLRTALEWLLDAIPGQTNDADWWPDELTTAVKNAKWALSSLPDPASNCICDNCNEPYFLDVSVNDELWKKISPRKIDGWKSGGLLCPQCIVDKIQSLISDPASKEQEGFAEWCSTNFYIYDSNHNWYHDVPNEKATARITTEQLYQLYKKKP